MIQFTRFDHVQLSIPLGAGAAAQAFYGTLLALPEIPGPHPRNTRWFQAGDVQLHLLEEAVARPLSDRHPAFEVANLAEVRAWLLRQGVPLEAAVPIAGRQRLFLRDPFGNRLELLQFD